MVSPTAALRVPDDIEPGAPHPHADLRAIRAALWQQPHNEANLPTIQALITQCLPEQSIALLPQAIRSAVVEHRARLAEMLLRKTPPAILDRWGLSLDFFQIVRYGQALPSEIETFVQQRQGVSWTILDPETQMSPLGIAILLCTCVDGYQAVVQKIIHHLSNEELQNACAHALSPLHYSVICGAVEVFNALYARPSAYRWLIRNHSPLHLLIFLAQGPELLPEPIIRLQKALRYFSKERYQALALRLIEHLSLDHLQEGGSGGPLLAAIQSRLPRIAGALLRRGAPYLVAPEGIASVISMDPASNRAYLDQDMVDNLIEHDFLG